MKKIYVLILLLIMLFSTFSFKLSFEEMKDGEDAIYTFYTLGNCSKINGTQIITNGNSQVVRTSFSKAKNVRRKLTNILGESVCFKGDLLKFSLIKENLNASLIIDETIENDIIIFSGFSENKKNDLKTININGQNINFQIAYNEGIITIGTPVILGDY